MIYQEVIKNSVIPYKGKTYTNDKDLINFFSNIYLDLETIPQKIHPSSRKNNERLNEEVNEILESISAGNAQIIYFTNVEYRWYLIGKIELFEHLKDHKIIEFNNGFIISSEGIKKS